MINILCCGVLYNTLWSSVNIFDPFFKINSMLGISSKQELKNVKQQV